VTTPAKRQATAGLPLRLVAFVGVLVVVALPLEWAREALARAVVHATYTVAGGSPTGLRIGGWLMFVAGPIAAVWYGHDLRRMIDNARSPQPALARFAGRRRGRVGHRARRSVSFWIKRAPLVVPIALALGFVVPRGFLGHTPANWAALPGGVDFMAGVRWSLIATFAAGTLVMLTEVALLTEPKRWLSTTVGVIALLMPVTALLILI
jgi:hypothetical protein